MLKDIEQEIGNKTLGRFTACFGRQDVAMRFYPDKYNIVSGSGT